MRQAAGKCGTRRPGDSGAAGPCCAVCGNTLRHWQTAYWETLRLSMASWHWASFFWFSG